MESIFIGRGTSFKGFCRDCIHLGKDSDEEPCKACDGTNDKFE